MHTALQVNIFVTSHRIPSLPPYNLWILPTHTLNLNTFLCEMRSALERPHRENKYLHTVVVDVDGKQQAIDPTPTTEDIADNDAILSLNPTMPESNTILGCPHRKFGIHLPLSSIHSAEKPQFNNPHATQTLVSTKTPSKTNNPTQHVVGRTESVPGKKGTKVPNKNKHSQQKFKCEETTMRLSRAGSNHCNCFINTQRIILQGVSHLNTIQPKQPARSSLTSANATEIDVHDRPQNAAHTGRAANIL